MGTALPPTPLIVAKLPSFNPLSHMLSVTNSMGQFYLTKHTTMYGSLLPGTRAKLLNDKATRNSSKLLLPKPLGKGVQLSPASDNGESLCSSSLDKSYSIMSLNYQEYCHWSSNQLHHSKSVSHCRVYISLTNNNR
jgi:hypothetical protein